jgi:uncharacterized protein involved in exopolysaccharide biosynthesis
MKEELQPEEEKGETKISNRDQGDPLEYDDGELNLIDLLLVVLRRKWLIICFVFFAGAGALGITLLMTDIYRSDATILPREEEKNASSLLSSALGGLGGTVAGMAGELGLGGSGSLEKLQVVLQSRYLARKVIEKYDLLPILFYDHWDPRTKKWKKKQWFGLLDMEEPTLQDGIKKLTEELLSVNSDSKMGTLKISFEDRDPEKAKSVVEYLLTETSETIREVVLRDAAENMKFFYDQLEKTTDPLLKAKIYEMLANQIENDTFARAQKYYGFYVPDPPFAPDLNKKAKPRRALICVIAVFCAFFIAVFVAFLLESVSRLKEKDPDRYNQMKDGLCLRRKRSRLSKEHRA